MRRYTPVHEDVRQRHSRKHRLYHDQCIWLDVVALARDGWFCPGLHAGDARAFSEELSNWDVRVPIATAMHQDEGVLQAEAPSGRLMSGLLTVEWPRRVDIPLKRLHTLPNRPRWYMLCPGTLSAPDCGKLVRRIFLPQSPPGIVATWACRHCWRLLHRDFRRPYVHAETVRHLHSLDALAADLARMRQVMVQELAELA
jgi:hypothetical protein